MTATLLKLPTPYTGEEAKPSIDPLLVTAGEAAKALAVSPRTLWGLTADKKIPCVKIGRLVRYRPADLRAFVDNGKR